jgi:hypothetical protein
LNQHGEGKAIEAIFSKSSYKRLFAWRQW